MTGSASVAGRYDLCSVATVPEEGFGEEIHVGIRRESRLADCS